MVENTVRENDRAGWTRLFFRFQKFPVAAVHQVKRFSDAATDPASDPTVGVPLGLNGLYAEEVDGDVAVGFSDGHAIKGEKQFFQVRRAAASTFLNCSPATTVHRSWVHDSRTGKRRPRGMRRTTPNDEPGRRSSEKRNCIAAPSIVTIKTKPLPCSLKPDTRAPD